MITINEFIIIVLLASVITLAIWCARIQSTITRLLELLDRLVNSIKEVADSIKELENKKR